MQQSNLLTSLPALPQNLIELYCGGNPLTNLPSLPGNLRTLEFSSTNLSSLPTLPSSLTNIESYSSALTSLPALPASLQQLICRSSLLTTLPALPAALVDLDCSFNNITALPALSAAIKYLDCSNNQLAALPSLSATSLTNLDCSQNQLASLPILSDHLINISCNYNQLSSLPPLPDSKNYLSCYNNQLTSLPTLPDSLRTLQCSYNQLTSLPALPDSFKYLNASFNLLTSLPELPDSLTALSITDNPTLNCLPQINQITNFQFNNTGIQCLPNYGNVTHSTPLLNTLPLCDIFNSNACAFYWKINGITFLDSNNNCLFDLNETGIKNLKLNLYSGSTLIQQAYSIDNGRYSFNPDTGSYTYTVDTSGLPMLLTCPPSGYHTSILTAADSLDYDMNFGLICKQGFDVGARNITAVRFIPGHPAIVNMAIGDMSHFYGLHCSAGVSGTVTVNITGPVTFAAPAQGALTPVISGNTLTYSIADFGVLNFISDFGVIILTDTTAQAGNSVCFNVMITPFSGDNDTTNNIYQHCFVVRNSFDPNVKEVSPNGAINPTQEWLTYTIQFQNTGSAPAQNIYILDTLSNNIDASSFSLLSYSHDLVTQLNGNVIRFNFPNINLIASTTDEPNSHGSVQYKVRLLQALPINTIISNTANIYFDFNAPIATNAVTNIISNSVSVTEISNEIKFSVFPNPVNNEARISFNLNHTSFIKFELYNALGKYVKFISDEKFTAGINELSFSTVNLSQGIYILKISIDGNVYTRRVVK